MDSYIIYPNGVKVPAEGKRLSPADDGRFTVTQLQDIVGGYIGIVDIGDMVLVYNDEGDLDDKPINQEATRLAAVSEGWKGYVAGPALVCRRGKIRA